MPTTAIALPTVTATRYVMPLREGGSLPGVVEGNDLGTYVLKFRGAGQGTKALVAEVIVGELYCRDRDFLQAAWDVDQDRLRALDPDVDLDAVCASLDLIRSVRAGEPAAELEHLLDTLVR